MVGGSAGFGLVADDGFVDADVIVEFLKVVVHRVTDDIRIVVRHVEVWSSRGRVEDSVDALYLFLAFLPGLKRHVS